ncbi:MAG TPA: efflux transporter outer membrane subunit [Vicinamibacterales bacterium]|jgi:multidrug efflux system outer membrane protein
MTAIPARSVTFRTLAAIGAVTVIAALMSGCMVGPDYKRPIVDTPGAYRTGDAGDPAAAGATAAAASIADQQWSQVFEDETLQTLIRTALEHNFDLQMAAARILEAQAQVGITRADQFPTVSAGVNVLGERPSVALGFPSTNLAAVEVQASAAWELDFWGKYRRATESARAQLLASQWGQRAVVTTLISQVSSGYFGLRALDLELDISKRTLESRLESLQLANVRERGGVTSLLDVRQAEQLVYGATSEIASLERQIVQQENFLSVLLGGFPGPVARGRSLTDQPHQPDVPAGLPSSLIERRPDIQRAEQELVAANAQIGVARAAFFPDIALTGQGGFESLALSALFSTTNIIWSAAATATQPVFTAGRIKSRVAIAEARRDEATIAYQQIVRESFREVSDALIGYQKIREAGAQLALLAESARDARRLAQVRYEGGVTSYLEVLDADTRLFAAELGLAQSQLNELSALVEIYRALGGGWQM